MDLLSELPGMRIAEAARGPKALAYAGVVDVLVGEEVQVTGHTFER